MVVILGHTALDQPIGNLRISAGHSTVARSDWHARITCNAGFEVNWQGAKQRHTHFRSLGGDTALPKNLML